MEATFYGVAKSQTCLSTYTSHVLGFQQVAFKIPIRYPSGTVMQAAREMNLTLGWEIRFGNTHMGYISIYIDGLRSWSRLS